MESELAVRKPFWQRFIMGGNPMFTMLRILVVVLVTLVLFKYVFLLTRVTGDSMMPTFQNGQVKLVNRLAYRKNPPQRLDIVVASFAGQEVFLIKRVIALPGETVQIIDGRVHVNGVKLVEPYTAGIVTHKIRDDRGRLFQLRTSRPIELEADEYFLVGDNREVTELHLEPRRKIIGKVIF